MMTEEEAKKKWCPFFRSAIAVRPGDDLEHSINRSDIRRPDNAPSDACLGSGCMAWRWGVGAPILRHKKTGSERPGTDQSFNPFEEDAIYPKGNEGYCGLAGKDGT